MVIEAVWRVDGLVHRRCGVRGPAQVKGNRVVSQDWDIPRKLSTSSQSPTTRETVCTRSLGQMSCRPRSTMTYCTGTGGPVIGENSTAAVEFLWPPPKRNGGEEEKDSQHCCTCELLVPVMPQLMLRLCAMPPYTVSRYWHPCRAALQENEGRSLGAQASAQSPDLLA